VEAVDDADVPDVEPAVAVDEPVELEEALPPTPICDKAWVILR
jgi:hypothetical protein